MYVAIAIAMYVANGLNDIHFEDKFYFTYSDRSNGYKFFKHHIYVYTVT